MRRLILLSFIAIGLLAACSGAPDAGQFRTGLQLYSVRQDLEADFTGTLQRVKDMGYDGVEFYNAFAGFTPQQVRQICDGIGLEVFSNHFPLQAVMTDLDRVLEDSKTLGLTYVTIPSIPSRPGATPDRFKETVAALDSIGAKVREAGFVLLYHNHDFEFAQLPDGTVGHDYMFASSDPDRLQLELDVCWADFAGQDVPAMVRRYAGRVPVLHMKDYTREGIGNRRIEFRPLGHGVMDLEAVLEAAGESGVRWLCVEQDEPATGAADRFEGPAASAVYLQEEIAAGS